MVLGLLTCLEKRTGFVSKEGSWAVRPGEGQLTPSTRHVSEVDQQEPEVKAHRLGLRKAASQRAQPREGRRRPVLVVEPDRRGSQGLWIVRSGLNRGEKLALRGDGAQGLLVGGAAQQVGLDDVRDAGEARDERGQARSAARMTEILGANGRRGIGLDPLRVLPGARRVGLLSRERKRQAELEPNERALWIAGRKDPQPARRACRPGLERLAHLLGDLRPRRRIR